LTTTNETIRFGTVGTPTTSPKRDTQTGIRHMCDLGMHHLEIAWTQSVRVTDETCAQIKAIATECDISLSVHAPYYINLNSQTSELMEKSDLRLLTAARKGYLAGAKDIIFHPGSYHTQPPEQVYERAKEKMLELTGILREEGVDVLLRPETMGKSAMFGDLAEIVQLSKEVPGVAPAIDWAHLHARCGDGRFNCYAEFCEALDLVKSELGEAGLKNMHFHMSGIEYTLKGERHHVPLNEADIAYRELIQAWIDYGVAGTCAVEAPEPFMVADAMVIQATYRRLLEKDKPVAEAESEE
jgi:deoxyribonuclease IV